MRKLVFIIVLISACYFAPAAVAEDLEDLAEAALKNLYAKPDADKNADSDDRHPVAEEMKFLRKYGYTKAADKLRKLTAERIYSEMLEEKRQPPNEDAVVASLRWLHFHQNSEGVNKGWWLTAGFQNECKRGTCEGKGVPELDVSGLCLTYFTDDSQSHRFGDFKKTVKYAFDALAWSVDNSGTFGRGAGRYRIVSHILASMGFCGLYRISLDKYVFAAADDSIKHLLSLRKPDFGWGFTGENTSNVFVTAAALYALDEARMAGIPAAKNFDWKSPLKYLAKISDDTGDVSMDKVSSDIPKVCPNCGKDVMKDSNFCRFCGKMIPAVKEPLNNCPKCGKQLAPDSRFCRFCGKQIFGASETQPEIYPDLKIAAMAAGLYIRALCGESADSKPVAAALKMVHDNLIKELSDINAKNYLVIYYFAKTIGILGVDWDNEFWSTIKLCTVKTQRRGGCPDGSWDPDKLAGFYGGRILATCLLNNSLRHYYNLRSKRTLKQEYADPCRNDLGKRDEMIIRSLANPASSMRLEALKRIAETKDPAFAAYIGQMLANDSLLGDKEVIERACGWLAKTDGPECCRALVAALKNPKALDCAVEGLAGTIAGYSIPALLEAANTSDVELQIGILKAMGAIEDPEFTFFAVKMLDNPDERVRMAAIEACGEIATPLAYEKLNALLKSTADEKIRSAISKALSRRAEKIK
jgi:endogenous inhibitor of DNA gyrase (YacG/DUF329 family)